MTDRPERGGGEPRPLHRSLAGVERVIDTISAVIMCTTLVSMFAALLVNVILRYVFGAGLVWAYEIHAILFPWLIAGGVVMATARGSNIAVTLISDVLSGLAKRIVVILVDIAVLVVAVQVVWTARPIIRAAGFQRLAELGVSQWWGYQSLNYAFGGIAILSVLALVRHLTGEPLSQGDPARASIS